MSCGGNNQLVGLGNGSIAKTKIESVWAMDPLQKTKIESVWAMDPLQKTKIGSVWAMDPLKKDEGWVGLGNGSIVQKLVHSVCTPNLAALFP